MLQFWINVCENELIQKDLNQSDSIICNCFGSLIPLVFKGIVISENPNDTDLADGEDDEDYGVTHYCADLLAQMTKIVK